MQGVRRRSETRRTVLGSIADDPFFSVHYCSRGIFGWSIPYLRTVRALLVDGPPQSTRHIAHFLSSSLLEYQEVID
jgi:hypothetical protein